MTVELDSNYMAIVLLHKHTILFLPVETGKNFRALIVCVCTGMYVCMNMCESSMTIIADVKNGNVFYNLLSLIFSQTICF